MKSSILSKKDSRIFIIAWQLTIKIIFCCVPLNSHRKININLEYTQYLLIIKTNLHLNWNIDITIYKSSSCLTNKFYFIKK